MFYGAFCLITGLISVTLALLWFKIAIDCLQRMSCVQWPIKIATSMLALESYFQIDNPIRAVWFFHSSKVTAQIVTAKVNAHLIYY